MGHLLGYARVSTAEQNAEPQTDELTAAGCWRVYVDHASGVLDRWPQLDVMLEQLRPGDTLVVWRLGRSLRQRRSSCRSWCAVAASLPASQAALSCADSRSSAVLAQGLRGDVSGNPPTVRGRSGERRRGHPAAATALSRNVRQPSGLAQPATGE